MISASTTRSFGNGNFSVTVEAIIVESGHHDITSVRVLNYRGDIPSWMDWYDWEDLCKDIANDLTHDLGHPVSPGEVKSALKTRLGTAAIGLE